MYGHLFRGECRLLGASPSFRGLVLVFLAMGVALALADPLPINEAQTGLHRNAPALVVFMLNAVSLLGVVVAAILVSTALLRDETARMDGLVRATPVRPGRLAAVRLAASMVLTGAVLLTAAAGMLLGSWAPWLPAESLGPNPWAAYVQVVLGLLLPNTLFAGAFVAVAVAWDRSVKPVVVAVLGLFVLHALANAFMRSSPLLSALLDPFGGQALDQAIQGWTSADINTRVPGSTGLGLNRLIWLAVSAVGAVGALRRLGRAPRDLGSPRRLKKAKAVALALVRPQAPVVWRRHGLFSESLKVLALTRRDLRETLASVPYPVALCMIAGWIAVSLVLDRGTGSLVSYPLTHLVVRVIHEGVGMPALLVLGFFAGDLVHRERETRLAALTDVCPLGTGTWVTGKALALGGLLAGVLAVCALAGLAFQWALGWTAVEPLLYLKSMMLIGLPLLAFALAALAFQVASPNRQVGYLGTAALAAAMVALPAVGVTDPLVLFARTAPVRYSDMNGFAPFLPGVLWFDAYWISLTAAGLVFASAWRVRGEEVGGRARTRAARRLLTSPARALGLGAWGFCWILMGVWIFHNTHVLNPAARVDPPPALASGYPPLPRITRVSVEVNLYPDVRRVAVRGAYTLTNKTQVPQTAVWITAASAVRTQIHLPNAVLLSRDASTGVSAYRLNRPLLPGQTLDLGFDLDLALTGFSPTADETSVVPNGTVITNAWFPAIGAPARLDVPSAHGASNAYLSNDADGIDFHAVVSTLATQTPLAPGKRVRTWTQGGRNYAEFVSERPMVNLYGFLSARWVVTREHWKGTTLEVYADPSHPWNVPTIMASLKDGLDTYGKVYGPYGLSEIRVAEVPGYKEGAQSFAGLIALSENLGFTSQPMPKGVDWAYLVTAHELAHQWWGHQVVPASAPGALVLSETLAEYSAVALVQAHRPEMLAAVLADEAHQYAQGLRQASGAAPSLSEITDQAFVAYHQGALVMMAYRKQWGAQATDRVLGAYFQNNAGWAAPYPKVAGLEAALRQPLSEKEGARVRHWFEAPGLLAVE